MGRISLNNKPLISVLMGIYNCADTLEEAVDSIKNQTYSNWELIMCDDCSSDNTYEKALEIAKGNNRIKVYKNEKNLTLAPTLNNCLKAASGKYIARMDGDDVCAPERFEKELNFLEENPEYAVVSTRMNMFDKDGIFRTTTVESFPTVKELVAGPPFCHAGCMMKKSVLDELGGYNTGEEVTRIEDYDLWYRLYKAGYKGANIQEALYSMRDDIKALKRRKFKYRVNSYKLRKKIIKTFNLPIKYYSKAIKPILVGLLPTPIYKVLHAKKSGGK
ncbi:MAG: glycosyltransferase family 2 protein [Ruminococcus sp.]|nr:glycosyltransferase family 2 protein [Ruminococcus sp.]